MSPIPKPDGWVHGQPFLRDTVCRFHGVVDRDANSAVLLTLEGECVALTGQSHPFTRDSREEAIRRRLFGSCLPRASARDLLLEVQEHARTPVVLTAGQLARAQLNAATGCSADVNLDQPVEAGWARVLRALRV